MSDRRRDARTRIEAELAATKAALERANRALALNALAGAVAHELSQPITALALNGMVALRRCKGRGRDVAAIREALQLIVSDADRARAIISNFQASAAEAGRRRAAFDIAALIDEVCGIMDGELRAAAIPVENRVPRDLPLLHGDRLRLRQVFLNLVANAAHALSGVLDRPRRLTIDGARGADGLILTVGDNGAGVDEALGARIFEAGVSGRAGGLGLGLFLCRAIVEDHGGALTLESRPGKTLFHVALPVAAPGA